ncbi:MAG: argininosuccinate synthase domain-containing protein, partial [Eggerthellaceae bacterium]
MADQKEKAVLAYSGGLDTSCCIKWLQENKGVDVIAVVGDVGQEHEGLEKIKQKALKSGALDCLVVDMRDTFAKEYLAKALAANAMYENKYPLVSALSRPLISKHLVDAAHKYGAKYIAHGCTGKGNDQVRFESSVTMLDPDIEILAPVREWDLLTRPEEIEWAQEHGIEVPA